jgi:predicted DNA-binding transcriptional regulator YafY
LKINDLGKGNNVILFDSNVDYTGLKFITPLFHAIVNQQVVNISYQDFKSEKSYAFEFHPYILKQYNQRWFSFGHNPERPDQIWNIALDRILEIKNVNAKYKSIDIDWEIDYFFDFVGVSKIEGEPVEIKIEIEEAQVPYIRTKPFHGTQKGPILTREGWIISIRVIPNYELKKLLLSFGDSIKIISPDSFKAEMKEIYAKALLKYD